MPALCLAIDGASPVASAALADPGALVAESTAPARGARSLLELVDDCFRQADRELAEVGAVVAICGPGSFTGLRVTLATAMGLVPGSSPVRLCGISSLAALALQASPGSHDVVALVDALQGEWFHQRFAPAEGGWRALDPPSRSPASSLTLDSAVVVAFAGDGPQPPVPFPQNGARIAARPLAAAVALAVAAGRAETLLEATLRPIYLRAPAVTPARPPAR